MSHFTTVRTRLTDTVQVVAALRDLGHDVSENADIRGFQGHTTRAEVVVRTGVDGYDVGLRSNDGALELVADWWGLKSFDREGFLNKLTQRYAYRVAKEQLERQGFTFVEDVVEADRSIRLTVRRMGA